MFALGSRVRDSKNIEVSMIAFNHRSESIGLCDSFEIFHTFFRRPFFSKSGGNIFPLFCFLIPNELREIKLQTIMHEEYIITVQCSN